MRYFTAYSVVITQNAIKHINLNDESVKIAGLLLDNEEFTTQNEY